MSGVEFKISNDVIKSLVEAKIKSSVIAALSDGEDKLILQMVTSMINHTVDSNGNPCSYGSVKYLDWLCQSSLKVAVKDAMKEVLNEQKEKIKEYIAKELTKKTKDLAVKATQNIIESVNNQWAPRINVEIIAGEIK